MDFDDIWKILLVIIPIILSIKDNKKEKAKKKDTQNKKKSTLTEVKRDKDKNINNNPKNNKKEHKPKEVEISDKGYIKSKSQYSDQGMSKGKSYIESNMPAGQHSGQMLLSKDEINKERKNGISSLEPIKEKNIVLGDDSNIIKNGEIVDIITNIKGTNAKKELRKAFIYSEILKNPSDSF